MATTLTIRGPDAAPIEIVVDEQFFIDLARQVLMPLIEGFDPMILSMARIPSQVILSRGAKLAREGKCDPPEALRGPLRHEFGPVGYAAYYGLSQMIGNEHVTLHTIEGAGGTNVLRLDQRDPIDSA
jgi:hypothetical protein